MRVGLFAVLWVVSAQSGHAEELQCPDSLFTVTAPSEHVAQLTCEAADKGAKLANTCNVPLFRPITITILEETETFPIGCNGVYHCGQDLIEVLAPDVIAAERSGAGKVANIDPETYFQSVIVHEIGHAALDQYLTAVGGQLAENEYVAYAFQLQVLSPADRKRFLEDYSVEQSVQLSDLNPMVANMAPIAFAARVWAHYNTAGNGCEFVKRLADGAVTLGRDFP